MLLGLVFFRISIESKYLFANIFCTVLGSNVSFKEYVILSELMKEERVFEL